jgi:hypothetical protein
VKVTNIMAEPGSDEALTQFNRLIEELLGGNLHRTIFQHWEIVILLDMATYWSESSKRRSILGEYQKAVQQTYADRSANPAEAL